MKVFSQRTADVLSEAYSAALSKGKPTEEALTCAQEELGDRMKLLSSKLALYERQFDTLIALAYYSYDGYIRFLFVRENDSKSCSNCLTNNEKVFSIEEIVGLWLVPNSFRREKTASGAIFTSCNSNKSRISNSPKATAPNSTISIFSLY